ncbi:MAG TPA: nitroreductase family protein [Limnochordia bacterium]|nr:nitroreductase family protein [Limnochordia bacterium]
MEMLKAIRSRRSIRHFKAHQIPRDVIEKLLDLTIQAPSAKNDQPWRFVVTTGEAKVSLVDKLQETLEEAKANAHHTGSMQNSVRAMAEAPVVILIFNRLGREDIPEPYHYARLLVDTQSIGAAIQTLLLAAQDMGLGTLWICDVLYATSQVQAFASTEEELVAAIALGVPAESPGPRPRQSWQELTTWMD